MSLHGDLLLYLFCHCSRWDLSLYPCLSPFFFASLITVVHVYQPCVALYPSLDACISTLCGSMSVSYAWLVISLIHVYQFCVFFVYFGVLRPAIFWIYVAFCPTYLYADFVLHMLVPLLSPLPPFLTYASFPCMSTVTIPHLRMFLACCHHCFSSMLASPSYVLSLFLTRVHFLPTITDSLFCLLLLTYFVPSVIVSHFPCISTIWSPFMPIPLVCILSHD